MRSLKQWHLCLGKSLKQRFKKEVGTRKLWKQIFTESRFYWHPSLTLKSQPMSKKTIPFKRRWFQRTRKPSQDKERNDFLMEVSEPRCQSLYQTPLQQWQWRSKTVQNYKADFGFSLLPEFSIICFDAAVPWGQMFMFSGPEFVCRERKVLEVHFCYSSSTPFSEPSAISKAHPASQPLGSHGKKTFPAFVSRKHAH